MRVTIGENPRLRRCHEKIIEQRKIIKQQELNSEEQRNKYVQEDKRIRRMCKKDKNNYINKICRKIKEHVCENTRSKSTNSRKLYNGPKVLKRPLYEILRQFLLKINFFFILIKLQN